jgi:PilZ domain-containing protein
MTSFPQSNPSQPAPRLKLDGSVPVAIRVEGTTSVRGKLRELSATGGLLVLAKPLDKGEFVELAFPTNNGSVQGMAEILEPRVEGSSGCLQPFRFIALEDGASNSLQMALASLQDRVTAEKGLRRG